MTKTLAIAAAFALAGAGMAQAAPEGVTSGTYALEPNHAEVLFGVSHLGFSTYYGQFPGATGTLVLNAKDVDDSRLDVTIPVAGLMTASSRLNDELKGDKWMDAGKYPTMTFHSTKIVPTGPTTADVTGDFTMHGVTKPVTLKATFNRAGANPMSKKSTIGFEVTGRLKRSDFGVATFLPMIGDDITLIISAPFEAQAS